LEPLQAEADPALPVPTGTSMRRAISAWAKPEK
jgi:hypothetical protein